MATPANSSRKTWISLDRMQLEAGIDVDAWGRPQTVQPVILSVQILYDIGTSAEDDDFTQTLDYSKLNSDIRRTATSSVAITPFNFFSATLALIDPSSGSKAWGVRLNLTLPKALLNSEEGVTYDFHLQRQGRGKDLQDTPFLRNNTVSINGLRVSCIIGVKDRERTVRQTIFISLKLKLNHKDLEFDRTGDEAKSQPPPLQSNWKQMIAQKVSEAMSNTSFLTVERAALEVERTVQKVIDDMWTDGERLHSIEKIQLLALSVKKPSALAGVEGSGVHFTYATPSSDTKYANNSWI